MREANAGLVREGQEEMLMEAVDIVEPAVADAFGAACGAVGGRIKIAKISFAGQMPFSTGGRKPGAGPLP
jgi:hypothetical protein